MTEEITLHPIERALLSSLSKGRREFVQIGDAARESGLTIDQVRRGVEWLKAKKLIEVRETEIQSYSLGKNGVVAVERGLPERKLVNLLKASGGSAKMSDVSRGLPGEFQIALGQAKKCGWIKFDGDTIHLVRSDAKEPEEILLQKISSRVRVAQTDLTKEDLAAIGTLKKRLEGFVELVRDKQVAISLSEMGYKVALQATLDQIDSITPKVLQTGEWKIKPLRSIDVTSPAPKLYAGRRHPMRMFMDEVREAFVSLGFEEIFGPIAQSAFWNFDALFIPQQHSAREMQDTFYVSGLRANLSSFKEQISTVKSAHENGGETGSIGWQYAWRVEEAERVVLRTHTTAVTISYLANNKPNEARVFSVGRVFRNEKANYKHNPEFYQIEGVMVGPKLNLRNLIFVLSKFYSKLGFNEIKFWPTYFPYTEPSLQTMIIHKETNKWMELGGLGMFRPEVTLPLGVKNPVLAWGLGLDRLVMLRYNVSDVRELFGSNQGWLRNQSVL
ncbi:MAG: phenylalanine--tRNA ligase subunit alpha [Nitrososphaerota archaeon]|nr:phenylalanine--tRNA ligase subunit alpha [Nitrososphaerota archaeon]